MQPAHRVHYVHQRPACFEKAAQELDSESQRVHVGNRGFRSDKPDKPALSCSFEVASVSRPDRSGAAIEERERDRIGMLALDAEVTLEVLWRDRVLVAERKRGAVSVAIEH